MTTKIRTLPDNNLPLVNIKHWYKINGQRSYHNKRKNFIKTLKKGDFVTVCGIEDNFVMEIIEVEKDHILCDYNTCIVRLHKDYIYPNYL